MIRDEVLEWNSPVKSYVFSNIDEILSEKWGGKWTDYRNKWNTLKEGDCTKQSQPEAPLYVLTELNSFCNLRCKMCKHAEDNGELVRKSMPLEMFSKIINQCAMYNVPALNIGYGTECTLHPEFDRIIDIVRGSSFIDKFFLSNGTTLTETMINNIFYAGFERVEISVDAASNDTYGRIRVNGNYLKLEDSIHKLLDEKFKRKTRLPIIRLSFCVQDANIDEIDLFYEKWKNKVDVIDFQKMEGNPKNTEGHSKMNCQDPFNRIVVDYLGDIYPCCSLLFQKEYKIGNINKDTILEAWNGDRMKALRYSLTNDTHMKHCDRCLFSTYGQ